jgi:hypothetical protein
MKQAAYSGGGRCDPPPHTHTPTFSCHLYLHRRHRHTHTNPLISTPITDMITGSRFPGYLANDPSDGAPQSESSGIVALTLQKMLLQTDGQRILLYVTALLLYLPSPSVHPPPQS